MRRWLMPIAALGAALVWLGLRRGTFERWLRNMRACSMPSASLYDRLWGRVLGRFYARVADEVMATCPAGLALDVGSGPGHLAVRLARASPDLSVVGVDILPSMVERAAASPFAAGTIEIAGWPARLPLLVRARLVRPADG